MLTMLQEALCQGRIDERVCLRLADLLIQHGGANDLEQLLKQSGIWCDRSTQLGHTLEFGQSFLGSEPSQVSEMYDEISSKWRCSRPILPPILIDHEMVEDRMRERADSVEQSFEERSRRYKLGEEIGRGGVGAIRICRDKSLLRTLVMKTLIDGTKSSAYALRKFIEEAQITAQLEHPNIVPVHDFGYFDNGEPFFTMKRIAGHTLREILKDLRHGEAEAVSKYTRLKLLTIFQQICMALSFAHSRGVLHRDIKPSNVMVGSFGETLLLDWGIAKVMGSSAVERDPAADSQSSVDGSSEGSVNFKLVGTPGYLSPEQARGAALDVRSDVYALGALLYEILCYKPVFYGKDADALIEKTLHERPVPPSVRAPDLSIPPRLDQICLRCLEKNPADRYATVEDISADIELYLSGVEDLDRRRRLSEERLEQGLLALEQYKRCHTRLEELQDEVFEMEERLLGPEPIEKKRPVWAKAAELQEVSSEKERQFAAASESLMAAVGFDPKNDEAANTLARLFWSKLRDAELAGDELGAVYYRETVEFYNRGIYDDLLKDVGRISVRTSPPGAKIRLARLIEMDHRLMPLMEEDMGFTPQLALKLERGHFMLRLSLRGYRDVIVPVVVDRGELTDVTCRFFTDEEIGQHFLYIPAGSFTMGGDDACYSARQRRTLYTGDYFMARYPVTCGEYLTFLNDGLRLGKDMTHHVPRLQSLGGWLWPLTENGYILPEESDLGPAWQIHWPVFGISCNDAQAFCTWYSERIGIPVRLPTEVEWEKAARGTDGRLYPWGNNFDATFCKMASSRPGESHIEKVGQFPIDVSPYGVYDMAGLISEYTLGRGTSDRDLAIVRGGSYDTTSPTDCRITHRYFVPRHLPNLSRGFRIVRDPPMAPDATMMHMIRSIPSGY